MCARLSEIKILRVELLPPTFSPSLPLLCCLWTNCNTLGNKSLKKKMLLKQIPDRFQVQPQQHQQTGDLGQPGGRIWHAKTGVKSYETSGFYILIHPT